MIKKKSTGQTAVKQDPHVAQLRKQAEEYLAGWKRAQADYSNLQKRTEEQRGQLVLAAVQEVVRTLLPVLDNFEQVIKHAKSQTQAAAGKTDKNTLVGLEMVEKQLRNVLASHGVSEITAVGKPFNPSLHEAIASVPGQKNICIDEHARGFKLGEVTLRASRVSVGNGEPIGSAKPGHVKSDA